MTAIEIDRQFIQDIQHNCDISDARDHGVYSMCTMVLKLRNLYKWEKGVEPWQEPEPGDLLDWIDAKENYWATIAGESYRDLKPNGNLISPIDLEDINNSLVGTDLYYGAGFGRSLKTVFFLAEKCEQRTIEGCPVIILGKEIAKEMASPFAMVQDGVIIIRKDALRFFFWDQVQEIRSSCRSSMQYALQAYGLFEDGKLDRDLFQKKLDTIVTEELNFFIYHEVGEILQKTLTSDILQKLVGHFPGSAMEFVCRAIKDILADTHPQGLISYIVREKQCSSLGFYVTFLDGLREKLFPEMFSAWQMYRQDGDWGHIEEARNVSWKKNLILAEEMRSLSQLIGSKDDQYITHRFNKTILTPLGLDNSPA